MRVVLVTVVFISSILDLRGEEIRVALYSDTGAGKSVDDAHDVLRSDLRFRVTKLKAKDIQSGRLADFDILVMPGGSGSKQGKALGEEGRQQIRKFVSGGKLYVGVCAGAYLATCDYPWSLHILDAKVIDRKHWARGFGDVELSLTRTGREALGIDRDRCTIYYHQGPLLAPAQNADVDDYQPLATFAGEIAKNGAPEGVMKGTTAVAAGTFGKGRVLCFSPHPEKTKGLTRTLLRAIHWCQQQ